VKEQVISVTMAARMFADCVNRVRYQGVSFLLKKNGISVARIVPVDPLSGMNLEDVVAPVGKLLPDASHYPKVALSFPEGLSAEADTPESLAMPQRSMLNW
jgi:antitoxin (DNA-binding transcriptional repressor) of toxin-antitoxin stability system